MHFIQNIVGHSHGDNLHTAEVLNGHASWLSPLVRGEDTEQQTGNLVRLPINAPEFFLFEIIRKI
jgi:hypothetical protein